LFEWLIISLYTTRLLYEISLAQVNNTKAYGDRQFSRISVMELLGARGAEISFNDATIAQIVSSKKKVN
jgi:hypothetical protein